MSSLPSVLPAWLASLTLVAVALCVATMLVLRFMRRCAASARRLVLMISVFVIVCAAVSRVVLPSWLPGILPPPAAVPLDGVVERVDRAMDGQPIPTELAAKIGPSSFISLQLPRGVILPPVLFGLWLGGVLLCLVQRLRGAWNIHYIIRNAEPLAKCSVLHREVAGLCEAAGMKTPSVKLSTGISGPFACGLGNAAWLVLPRNFAVQNEVSRTAMLQHELAHLRHGDSLLQVLVSFFCCVQWFNPFVHWMEHRLRVECEKACDDAVLRHNIAPADYADLLLDLYQQRSHAPGLAVTGGLRGQRRCREMMRDRILSLADATLARSYPHRAVQHVLVWAAFACGSAIGAIRIQDDTAWFFHMAEQKLPAEEALVAHWTMDGGDEPAMRSVNVRMERQGRIDAALAFNGIDSYLDLDPAVISNVPFPWTFCGWMRSTDTTENHALIYAGSGKHTEYLSLGLEDGRASLTARNGPERHPLMSERIVADGKWHHLAGVFYSATHRELYVDGRLVAEENKYRRRPAIARLQIGRNGRDAITDFFQGSADDVRVYRAALDSGELQAIMSAGRRLLAVPAKAGH